MIRAGQLRHRVSFQQQIGTSRDTHGQPVPEWETQATVWASIDPLSGRELWVAQQTLATATHKIACRWSSSTTAVMTGTNRAVSGGRTFHGEWCHDVDEENRRIEFVCVEVTT